MFIYGIEIVKRISNIIHDPFLFELLLTSANNTIRIRIRIQIILFRIYKYGTISVTAIYINKHDSRINPGNRYKDICRGTSVTVRLPGQ